jgi:hypothetical protein
LAQLLAALGLSRSAIAVALQIDERTLSKYHEADVVDGPSMVIGRLVQSLAEAARNGSVQAQRFLLSNVERLSSPMISVRGRRRPRPLGKKERERLAAIVRPKGGWGDLIN